MSRWSVIWGEHLTPYVVYFQIENAVLIEDGPNTFLFVISTHVIARNGTMQVYRSHVLKQKETTLSILFEHLMQKVSGHLSKSAVDPGNHARRTSVCRFPSKKYPFYASLFHLSIT